jgi:hypothetical protein
VDILFSFPLCSNPHQTLYLSAPITVALTKKFKAAFLEEDAAPVKNGHKWPSSHRSVKKKEGKKIPNEIYDMADTPFQSRVPSSFTPT